MREILFRAKEADNEYGLWVEGNLAYDDIINVYENYEWVEHYVIPETVGQYTGLTDKNGKKIFEGDILRCVDELNAIEFYARVEFGNPNAGYDWGWQLVKIKGDEPNLDILLWVEAGIDDYVHCQVIGNIHDNPELLDEVRE